MSIDGKVGNLDFRVEDNASGVSIERGMDTQQSPSDLSHRSERP